MSALNRVISLLERLRWLPSALIACSLAGCLSRGKPEAINTSFVNPAEAAANAFQQYDRNADGRLDAAEMAACPGILAAKAGYDANNDGVITSEELTSALTAMYGRGVGLTRVTCIVTSGGRPLSGAEVKFIPEPFLGTGILPANGTSDANGTATVAIPDEQLPANQRGLHSMQPGIYRVEITHPSLKQPAKPQGCEVNPSVRDGNVITIKL